MTRYAIPPDGNGSESANKRICLHKCIYEGDIMPILTLSTAINCKIFYFKIYMIST